MSCKSVSDASTAFSPSCFHNTGAENQGREEELPACSQTLAEESVWSQARKGSPNEKRESVSGGEKRLWENQCKGETYRGTEYSGGEMPDSSQF